MDLLEGRNPVLEALGAGLAIKKVYLAKGAKGAAIGHIIGLCKQTNVNWQWTEREFLDKKSSTGMHQGVVAELAPVGYTDLDQVLKQVEASARDMLLVLLDEIEDPQNLGSIIRTAEAAGAHGVIIPRHRAAGLSAAVGRASAGAVFHLPLVQVTNLVQTLKILKDAGAWVAGTDAEAQQTAFEANLTGPLVLVLGNEHRGMGRLLRENCDFLVKLPMLGQISSLNVGVSAGIMLYEIMRQRLKS